MLNPLLLNSVLPSKTGAIKRKKLQMCNIKSKVEKADSFAV
jgi:hypothetical protein